MKVVVGLGGNLGSRAHTLRLAMFCLERRFGALRASSLVETPAMVLEGQEPGPNYLNAAVALECDVPMRALLEELHRIEAKLGRVRQQRWGDRTLDLDILWAEQPYDDGDLCIPHRGLLERNFALGPLLEVMPELAERFAGIALEPVAPAGPSDALDALAAELEGLLRGESKGPWQVSAAREELPARLKGAPGQRLTILQEGDLYRVVVM